ncbi:hypothetical protein [Streptomyces sp. NBC_00158]|uniref:hypothetical protein n=1 Tax=Streptomyces sp. NBC_00158 TaxID=2903627 RepID=UPI0032561BB6
MFASLILSAAALALTGAPAHAAEVPGCGGTRVATRDIVQQGEVLARIEINREATRWCAVNVHQGVYWGYPFYTGINLTGQEGSAAVPDKGVFKYAAGPVYLPLGNCVWGYGVADQSSAGTGWVC